MGVNFQLCGNKTHFTMLHTPNRISPIASSSGEDNDSNAEADNSKNVSANIEQLTVVFANVSDPAILSILYCFFHIAA